MRQWGRLSLELLFVALLYTEVGVVLGVFSVGWGSPIDVTRLLLQNLLALIPLVFFIWKADGPWWSVGGTCALALALLQVVVPRMEMLLERGQTLIQLPVLALNAVGAAAAAVAALMMMLRPWNDGDSMPPYFWPAGAPLSYFWRIPAVVVVAGVAHMMAAVIGRTLVGQTGRPAVVIELMDKTALGFLVALAAFVCAAHLGVRSPRRVQVLVGILGVVPAIGRLQQAAGSPFGYMLPRVGLRVLADLVVGLLSAILFLVAVSSRQHLEVPLRGGERPDGEPGEDDPEETAYSGS